MEHLNRSLKPHLAEQLPESGQLHSTATLDFVHFGTHGASWACHDVRSL